MANSGYYTEPKLNATGGGGSSLTIREADGTPSGVVTELVFPNTSVAIAGGVGTLSLVVASDLANFATSDHTHGNIENDGAIGTTANLPIITGENGFLQTGSFGTTANTFCQGNDSRLSDARTPLAHNQAWSTITATPTTLSGYGITDGQSTLVSGTNIRTVNGNSLLGSGDLTISGLSAIASQTILGNNTGGSAVPTGLTASDVRALLGLATTDSPTFAGLTLGTSGILVGGTNRIEQRNGTNAQILEIAKTWSSTTVFEELTLDAASDASNYRIGSRIGSTGGTTRGLQLGRYDAAGAWTSWLGIDTSGVLTINGSILPTTTNTIDLGSSAIRFRTGFFAAGVTAAGNSNFATINAATYLGTGDITFTPSSSRTLSTNGQFTFETPSNTEGNLVYRGSDGTTRRFRFPIGVYSLPLTDGTNGQVLKTNGAGVVTWQNDNTGGGGGGGGVSSAFVIAMATAL